MVYADYAATCPVVKYSQRLYRDVLGEGYFLNPNANYAYKEKRLLTEAENRVKKAIGAKGGKVVFGGTVSQLVENLFTHIAEETSDYLTISSIYEHDAVFRFADQWGDIDSLKHVIHTYKGGKQLIVCLMGVNNVTGSVFDVEEIGRLCKKHGAFFVCDMTAMIGHAPIPVNIDDWCDCTFWSGHKIGTELGIGAMWLSKNFNDWLGDFKLHGTPNVAGALAMTQAVEDACNSKTFEDRNNHWLDLFWKMVEGLQKEHIHGEVYNGTLNEDKSDANEPAETTCAINAIRLNGINADALQQYLASKQIYVGLGASACAESHDYRVLNAFGLSDEEASEVIRVSFGDSNGADDVFNLVKGIKEFKERFIR